MIGGARLSFAVGCHRLVEAEVSCYNRAWHQLPSQTRDYTAPLAPGQKVGSHGGRGSKGSQGSQREHKEPQEHAKFP
jgi:hypothetical protein